MLAETTSGVFFACGPKITARNGTPTSEMTATDCSVFKAKMAQGGIIAARRAPSGPIGP